MEKRKIIIDCDPGVDDALALALTAAWKDKLEVLAVTTVSGNQTIEKVTDNALKLTEFYGLDVPVAQGLETPIIREPQYAANIHGDSGIGYAVLPETDRKPVEKKAVLYLADLLLGLPEGEKITIVATGPMTNIGLLLRLFPEVKEHILEIIFMGGSLCGGNVTLSAEFNIYVDPEAADIVIHSGIPLVMCGLDVTTQCTLKRNHILKMCQSGNPVAQLCGEMVGYELDNTASAIRGEVNIHDAVTIMYLVHPEIFTGKRMILDVDCSEGKSRGTTMGAFFWWKNEEKDTNALVLTDEVDQEKFREYLISALYELGASKQNN